MKDRADTGKPLLLRGRDAEAYDRFQKAAEWPMLALTSRRSRLVLSA